MKRNGKVLNAREVRVGRKLLRCAAERRTLTEQAKALLGRGSEFAARFARAAQMTGCVTPSDLALLVLAAHDGEPEATRIASELESIAQFREVNQPPEEWDDYEEAEACRRLAAAIRVVAR